MKIAPALLLAALGTLALDAAPAVPNDEAAVTHALNRLTFGPRPGDVARVKGTGLARWIDQQLKPAGIANSPLDARLARLQTLTLDSATIGRTFFEARQQRQAQQRAASADASMAPGDLSMPARPMNPAVTDERRIFTELAEAEAAPSRLQRATARGGARRFLVQPLQRLRAKGANRHLRRRVRA